MFIIKECEFDIKNSLEQLDRCISILVPKDDLFTNEDFSLENSKKPKEKQPNSLLQTAEDSNVTSENDNASNSDDDSDSSEDDFVEVPSKKTKEELEEDRYVELRYLGLLNENTNSTEAMTLERFKNVNLSIELNLRENEENKVVIEIMRDLYKELKKSSLVKVNNWIKVMFE